MTPSDQTQLRVGVVGAGRYARTVVVPVLDALDGVVVAAVCDVDPERARSLAAEFRTALHFGSAAEMLASAHLDAVVVATPPETQYAAAMAALVAGRHVLCGSPLTETQTDARTVRDAASRGGRVLAADYPLAALLLHATRPIQGGAIGAVTSFDATRLVEGRPWGEWLRGDPGGIVARLGADVLMVLRRIEPLALGRLSGASADTAPDGLVGADGVTLHVHLRNSAHVTGAIRLAWGDAIPTARLRLMLAGENGTLDVELVSRDNGARLMTTLAVHGRDPVIREHSASPSVGFRIVAANWAAAIRHGEKALFPPLHAISVRALLDQVRPRLVGGLHHGPTVGERPDEPLGWLAGGPFRIGVAGAGRYAREM